MDTHFSRYLISILNSAFLISERRQLHTRRPSAPVMERVRGLLGRAGRAPQTRLHHSRSHTAAPLRGGAASVWDGAAESPSHRARSGPGPYLREGAGPAGHPSSAPWRDRERQEAGGAGPRNRAGNCVPAPAAAPCAVCSGGDGPGRGRGSGERCEGRYEVDSEGRGPV